MNYIGIRGHRGSGKSTIAYLLGNTLEFMMRHGRSEDLFDQYKLSFHRWCEIVKNNPIAIKMAELSYVIYEEFGDTPKMVLSMLTGISLQDMNDDWFKDHTYINLRTFDTWTGEVAPDNLVTAEELFDQFEVTYTPSAITKDVVMTLRQLVIYFGVYVMQNAFGMNVWIKSMQANSRYFGGLFPDDMAGTCFKIFSDIKSRSEITYIQDHQGLIIQVTRPGHEKKGGMNLLRGDGRFDYKIEIDGELEDLWLKVWRVCERIVARFNKQREAKKAAKNESV